MSKVAQPGEVYGRLTIEAEGELYTTPSGHVSRTVVCRCSCGKTAVVQVKLMRAGKTRSCGCLAYSNRRTHGQKHTPTYRVWCAMKDRCYRQNCKGYPKYGGRGIQVCDEWRNSFESFFAAVGERPPGMSLDRIDNNGNYEPGNVRWATMAQQCRNRRSNLLVRAGDEIMVCVDAAKRFGVGYAALRSSLKTNGSLAKRLGLSLEKRT